MVINLIFYFTGSGNSYFIAKKISSFLNENLISINNSIKIQNYLNIDQKYEYELKDDEYIGFVFPIYYFGVPNVINNFIDKLKLINYKNQYIFAIITYDISYGDSYYQFKKLLEKNNYFLNSIFSVKMPGNCILLYNPKSNEEQKNIFKNAILSLENIKEDILNKKITSQRKDIINNIIHFLLKKFFYNIYTTKKYYVLNNCIHCSLCVSKCPSNIICLDNTSKKPVWKNDGCVHCLSCINNCPVQAIQYGNLTKKRDRYNLNNLIKKLD